MGTVRNFAGTGNNCEDVVKVFQGSVRTSQLRMFRITEGLGSTPCSGPGCHCGVSCGKSECFALRCTAKACRYALF